MKYIDAGYVAALGGLFLYTVYLWQRRRGLERTVRNVQDEASRS